MHDQYAAQQAVHAADTWPDVIDNNDKIVNTNNAKWNDFILKCSNNNI